MIVVTIINKLKDHILKYKFNFFIKITTKKNIYKSSYFFNYI